MQNNNKGAQQSMVVDPSDKETYAVYPPRVDAVDPVVVNKGDLKRLRDGEYFNDSLIDLKVRHFLCNVEEQERMDKTHAFSCLFYTKLMEARNEKGHKLVSRWTKLLNIFDMEFVLVPINLHNHWSLMVIVRPGIFAVR